MAVLVLAMTASIAGLVISCLVVRVQVVAAADLGALAGADVVLRGPDAACDRASAVVTANGAQLRQCTVSGAAVQLEVVAAAPPAVARLLPEGRAWIHAQSRAELVGAEATVAEAGGSRGVADRGE